MNESCFFSVDNLYNGIFLLFRGGKIRTAGLVRVRATLDIGHVGAVLAVAVSYTGTLDGGVPFFIYGSFDGLFASI